MDEIKNEYEEFFKFLIDEVINLRANDHIFSEVQKLVEKNPSINKPNSFFDWMAEAYVTDITIRLRKLAEDDRKVRSLIRLLIKIESDQKVRSRKWHLDLYQKDPIWQSLANRTFDKMAGKGKAEYPAEKVRKHINLLKARMAKIEIYVNNFIAHSPIQIVQPNEFYSTPTFVDVKKTMRYVERIIKKYKLLIFAAQVPSLLPTWQYNWKKIFEVPWKVDSP